MGIIRIITPPWNLYAFGQVVAHDMLHREELCRVAQGEVIFLTTDAPIELGIA